MVMKNGVLLPGREEQVLIDEARGPSEPKSKMQDKISR
jgi:hypothetical protein